MRWDCGLKSPPLGRGEDGAVVHWPDDEERLLKAGDEECVWIWSQPEAVILPRLETPPYRKRVRRRRQTYHEQDRPNSHEDLTAGSSPLRIHLKRSNSASGCITLLPPIAPANRQKEVIVGSKHGHFDFVAPDAMKQHEQSPRRETSSTQTHLWGACLEDAIAMFEAQEIILTAELDSDERCRIALEQHVNMEESVSSVTRPADKKPRSVSVQKSELNQAAYLQSKRSYEHVKQKLMALEKAIAQNKEKLAAVRQRIKELSTDESSDSVMISTSARVPDKQVTGYDNIPAAVDDVVPASVEMKRRKTGKRKSKQHAAEAIEARDKAAARIQKVFRVFMARQRLLELVRRVYKRVLDPESQQYFYFNTKTQQSQWQQPKLLLTAQRNGSYRRARLSLDAAATRIQALYRRRTARVALRTLLSGLYEKIYDAESDSYFYYCKKTNTSQWDKPKLLRQDDLLPSNSTSTAAKIDEEQAAAASRIQKLYRSRATRLFLMDLARGHLEKIFDADFQTWYFFNHRTQQTFWETARHAQLTA